MKDPLQQQAVQLLLTCLPDKLLPLFATREHTESQLYHCLNLRQAITVKRQDELAGLLGYYHHGHSFLNLPASALAVPVKPQQFYIEILCTAPDYRRQGIARELLQQANHLAWRSHCSELALDVCCGNQEAIQTYRRFGFQLAGQHRAQVPLQQMRFYRMIAPIRS